MKTTEATTMEDKDKYDNNEDDGSNNNERQR